MRSRLQIVWCTLIHSWLIRARISGPYVDATFFAAWLTGQSPACHENTWVAACLAHFSKLSRPTLLYFDKIVEDWYIGKMWQCVVICPKAYLKCSIHAGIPWQIIYQSSALQKKRVTSVFIRSARGVELHQSWTAIISGILYTFRRGTFLHNPHDISSQAHLGRGIF